MARTLTVVFPLVILAAGLSAGAGAPAHRAATAAAALVADSSGGVQLAFSPATGAVRLARLEPGALPLPGATAVEKGAEVLHRYGAAFGVVDPQAELELAEQQADHLGHTHLVYRQLHRGLPVFAAELRVHLDHEGQLTAVNGALVPAVEVDTTPSLDPHQAATRALALAAKHRARPDGPPLQVVGTTLLVFRTGLVRGVPGRDHLAFKVEVTDHAAFAEEVFVDAHDGRLLDRVTRAHDLVRRVHRDRYPNPVWREGDALPYTGGNAATNAEVNLLIQIAAEVHSLFMNLSGGTYRSFDGADAIMHSVQNATYLDCPNATWNGAHVSFCLGMASDDVIAHEWVHGYTQYTHGLIYQWQPGALNEAYSDIFGEVVDLLNGTGTDTPGGPRSASGCSAFAGPGPPSLVVHSPPSVAGTYAVGNAVFNPLPPWSVQGILELVADADEPTSDGCGPLVGFTAGRVALVDRGNCYFRVKAQNALDAGAVGVIVANNDGDDLVAMAGDGPRFPIPAVFVGQSTGAAFKAALPDGVTVTVAVEAASDPSVRWLIGEDTNLGPIRDMWQPACAGDPGRLGDPFYFCGEGDNGGVHTNSGVPNHAFALLADGGEYNGVTVGGIGLTRAVHLYWRAMRHFQLPTTGFAHHAEALELACRDLVGRPLADLVTGAPSGEVLSGWDCDQVAAAMRAVEMRAEPTQCAFSPLLATGEPTVLGRAVLHEDFETDPGGRWTVTSQGVFPEYRPVDWAWTDAPPGGGSGRAMVALDSVDNGDCVPGSDDQSGVMRLDSPVVTLPADSGEPVLTFDHYYATEPLYDGGNLKVSVNGGPFQLVPAALFRFNPYNGTLETAANGNTNPLAGQPAFNGSNPGSLQGSWGQSQVSLGGVVSPGDTLVVRFELGVDGCNGLDGWYVDNVRLTVGPNPRRGGNRPAAPAP